METFRRFFSSWKANSLKLIIFHKPHELELSTWTSLGSLAVVGMVIKIQCLIIPRKFIIRNINLFQVNSLEKGNGLPSMGSHRVGHDWSDLAAAAVKFIICCINVSASRSRFHVESADFHNSATRITDLVFCESYAFEYPVLAKFLGSQCYRNMWVFYSQLKN